MSIVTEFSSESFSGSGRFVDETRHHGFRRLKESSLGFGCDIYSLLVDVWDECKSENWDGYSALPLSWDVLYNVERFLDALPLGIPAPAIVPEADGHISLEWYKSARNLVSVSVSDDGRLHYAATFGSNRHYGTVVFLDDAPEPILDLIRQVIAE